MTPNLPPEGEIGEVIAKVRTAQAAWQDRPVRDRCAAVRRLRQQLADDPEGFASTLAEIRQVGAAEVLSTEILPFLAACRFLESDAERILRPRKLASRGRPSWLGAAKSRVEKQPWGTILILGPSNYPLFLPGVQLLQALVAGSGVLLKPAPGCSAPMETLWNLMQKAGFPAELVRLLPEDPTRSIQAIRNGVDKVILTGGMTAGRAVLAECAQSLIPATMELSGLDALIVRADADPQRVVDAIQFGLSLNRGETCIAPRRIYLHQSVADSVLEKLAALKPASQPTPISATTAERIRDSIERGASPVVGKLDASTLELTYPLILNQVAEDSLLWTEDHFSPIAALKVVRDDEEGFQHLAKTGFALAASIFTNDLSAARRLQGRIPAGVVTVNDLIAPTADPRLPFGGRQHSGFGVTRGEEGLLEMTTPRVFIERSSHSWAPHLEGEHPDNAQLFLHFIRIGHGSRVMSRLKAFCAMIKLVANRRK